MNKKERFDLARAKGLTWPKAEVTNDYASVQECYTAYSTHIHEHELEFDRHEFMKFSKGWRESLMHLQTKSGGTFSAPPLELFYAKAREIENINRVKIEAEKHEQKWFQAHERANMLMEVCEDILGAGILSDAQEMTVSTTKDLMESIASNIKHGKMATDAQLQKITAHEARVLAIYDEVETD